MLDDGKTEMGESTRREVEEVGGGAWHKRMCGLRDELWNRRSNRITKGRKYQKHPNTSMCWSEPRVQKGNAHHGLWRNKSLHPLEQVPSLLPCLSRPRLHNRLRHHPLAKCLEHEIHYVGNMFRCHNITRWRQLNWFVHSQSRLKHVI